MNIFGVMVKRASEIKTRSKSGTVTAVISGVAHLRPSYSSPVVSNVERGTSFKVRPGRSRPGWTPVLVNGNKAFIPRVIVHGAEKATGSPAGEQDPDMIMLGGRG